MATRLRTDAAQLRAPRVKDDGTTVFDAALVYADKPLQYGWGVEIPTEGALSSAAYLESLRGQPVVIGDGVEASDRHPEGERIDGARDASGRELRIVGTVVGARYDAAERCVIVELAIHAPEHATEVRRLGGISEGYSAQVEDGRQIARTTNHIAIVQTGRAPGSGVRADAAGETKMDPELKAALDAIAASLGKLEGIMLGKGMGEVEEVKVADADPEAAAKDEAAMAEKIEARADALAVERVSLLRRADSLQIAIPANVKTTAQIRRHIAIDLGLDAKRADSAEVATAWIEARATATDTDADRMSRGAVRADSTAYVPTF